MAKSRPSPTPDEHEGMSLDQLSQAFATTLGANDSPSQVANVPQSADSKAAVDPRAILEAMVFVGRPDNLPLTSQQIADSIPDVAANEIDRLVAELNAGYAANGCPYMIAADGDGYRMVLASRFGPVRDRVQGRNRAARLSPAAIEVLALVAYNEPLSAEQVTQLRGVPSGHILSQLVRRRLLRLERSETKPPKVKYFTTGRFLEVFRLRSLADLPRSDELARQ